MSTTVKKGLKAGTSPDDKLRLHSSSLSGCPTRNWFVVRSMERPFNEAEYAYLESGMVMEMAVIRKWREIFSLKYTGWNQITMWDDYAIARPDGIGRNGHQFLLQVKSCNQALYGRIKGLGVKQAKPDYYASEQLKMYLARGSKELADVTESALIVRNRNYIEDHLEVIPYVEEDALEAHEQAIRAVQSEEPPEPTLNRNLSPCTYCRSREECLMRFPLTQHEYAKVPEEAISQAGTSELPKATEELLLTLSERRLRIASAAKILKEEMEHINKEIEKLVPIGASVALRGKYLVANVSFHRNVLNQSALPPDVKAAFTEQRFYNKITIRDISGRRDLEDAEQPDSI